MDDKTRISPAAIDHADFFRIIFKRNAFLQIAVHNLYFQRKDFFLNISLRSVLELFQQQYFHNNIHHHINNPNIT